MPYSQKLNASFIIAACFAALSLLAPAVRAGSIVVYDFTFSGPSVTLANGDTSGILFGQGELDTVEVGNTGVYNVVDGTIDSLSWPGVSTYVAPPPFSLVPNPSPGNPVYSNDYGFIYDDLLFPSYTSSATSSKIDYWGLLFQKTETNGTLDELNLYSQNLFGTPYVYYEKTGINESLNSFTLTNVGSNVGISAPVPLPGSAGVGVSMFGGLGVIALVRKRLKQSANFNFCEKISGTLC